MTNETKLEPCPFCKIGAIHETFNHLNCMNCGARWTYMRRNCRPIEADLRAKLETVSRALKITMGEHFTVDNHGSKEIREAVAIAEQVLKGDL